MCCIAQFNNTKLATIFQFSKFFLKKMNFWDLYAKKVLQRQINVIKQNPSARICVSVTTAGATRRPRPHKYNGG